MHVSPKTQKWGQRRLRRCLNVSNLVFDFLHRRPQIYRGSVMPADIQALGNVRAAH